MAMCVLRNGHVGLDFSEAMRNLNLVEPNRLNVPNIEEKNEKEKNSSPETVHLIEKGDETARTEKSGDDASCKWFQGICHEKWPILLRKEWKNEWKWAEIREIAPQD